ncbi:MAG: hypothetical protein QXR87_06300 [Candidatus Hadarchaeales archaeon]
MSYYQARKYFAEREKRKRVQGEGRKEEKQEPTLYDFSPFALKGVIKPAGEEG